MRGLSGREGGGEDTLAGVSCPPPIFKFMSCQEIEGGDEDTLAVLFAPPPHTHTHFYVHELFLKSSSVSAKELVWYSGLEIQLLMGRKTKKNTSLS